MITLSGFHRVFIASMILKLFLRPFLTKQFSFDNAEIVVVDGQKRDVSFLASYTSL